MFTPVNGLGALSYFAVNVGLLPLFPFIAVGPIGGLSILMIFGSFKLLIAEAGFCCYPFSLYNRSVFSSYFSAAFS